MQPSWPPEIGPNLASKEEEKAKKRRDVPPHAHFDVNKLIGTFLGNKVKIMIQSSFTYMQPWLFVRTREHVSQTRLLFELPAEEGTAANLDPKTSRQPAARR